MLDDKSQGTSVSMCGGAKPGHHSSGLPFPLLCEDVGPVGEGLAVQEMLEAELTDEVLDEGAGQPAHRAGKHPSCRPQF